MAGAIVNALLSEAFNGMFAISKRIVYATRVNPNESAALIDGAGGPSAFGKLLGIDSGDGWVQRVSNWKRRGIPSDVVLEHYETIQKLQAERKPS